MKRGDKIGEFRDFATFLIGYVVLDIIVVASFAATLIWKIITS